MYSLLDSSDLLGMSVGPLSAYNSTHQEDSSYNEDIHRWQEGSYYGGNDTYAGQDVVYNDSSAPGYYSGSLDIIQSHGDANWFGGWGFGNSSSHDDIVHDHYSWSGGNGWFANDSSHSHDQFNFADWYQGAFSGYTSSHINDSQSESHFYSLCGSSAVYQQSHSNQWTVAISGPGYTEQWTHLDKVTHTVIYVSQANGYGGKG
jgi:hypothetical protein